MRERIINYMKEYGAITTYEAFIELDCSRLAEYIRQIKEEYVVCDEWITTTNRKGEKKRYKQYWLEGGL